MKLYELLKEIDFISLEGKVGYEIDNITWDSREVGEKSLFVAVKNKNVDRHEYVLDAVNKGAKAIVVERKIEDLPDDITVIKVKDSRKMMALLAKNFYDNPMNKLKSVGITGTNGKTSVSYFIGKVLETMKIKCGVIGTIENTIEGKTLKTKKLNPTTPDSIELQASLKEMIENQATHLAIEVTSAALDKDRVYGLEFDIAVFTNLTQDHLDDHGTMENYKKAKLKLFNMCKKAVVNIDDEFSKEILLAASCKVLTYGIDKECDFRATDIEFLKSGVKFNLKFHSEKKKVELNIPGRFSVYNALATIASCHELGFEIDKIIDGIKEIKGVPGRFQVIENSKGIIPIVDYAHTPDALENVLTSAREITKGKVITVFGCGGDRDSSKRPIMGEIAGSYSDYCIITSDNPRKEEPISIIDDIDKGITKTNCVYEKLEDRKKAIFKALSKAQAGDIVLIAGKGHENYQIIGEEKVHFSDVEVVEEFLSYN